ncbi:PPR domain-containing protein/PPR_2 domain-containing protein [Cephalotus follicularis]|uniref:PPR domain-containing protein/PPR_2 domain-containing protein n=1 Tax=Cephalotus follicularis TaxID=3775 RepID=A0A1Q3D1B6_CEPFO|nr:PPR domain-containing protein/PPR_2 domain-containing protein [Cephalotus follicularis]
MASAILLNTLNRSLSLTSRNSIIITRTYHYKRKLSQRSNLFSRISPLGDPDVRLAPVLDQWVLEGRKVNELQLQRIVRDLRARKRYTQALEVSEWMSGTGRCSFSPGDHAVQLDLIGKVHGLECAESYFNSLSEQDKVDKIYGALLNCYVREGLVDKSLSLLQKMKEMGFASNPLTYNDLMCVYTHTGKLEKVPDVLLDMKANGVSPDNFSYRICINSYGARSDLSGMKKVLEEMESQPRIIMDWATYATVANYYIKAAFNEQGLFYLKKCEENVDKDALGYNNLISLYASLGNKDEMMRLWGLEKAKCKKQLNREYITMLGSLVKIGDLDEAEKLLGEWEASCQNYDFRVPNVLLIGYARKGLIEKAEAMLRGMVERGRTPIPNSWAIVAAEYMEKQNMEKAFECFKEALAVQAENKGWRPKPGMVSSILNWLGDNGGTAEVEAFISLLNTKVLKTREMYHVLMKACIRDGKDIDGLMRDMKNDEIEQDEETKMILNSRLHKS